MSGGSLLYLCTVGCPKKKNFLGLNLFLNAYGVKYFWEFYQIFRKWFRGRANRFCTKNRAFLAFIELFLIIAKKSVIFGFWVNILKENFPFFNFMCISNNPGKNYTFQKEGDAHTCLHISLPNLVTAIPNSFQR